MNERVFRPGDFNDDIALPGDDWHDAHDREEAWTLMSDESEVEQ